MKIMIFLLIAIGWQSVILGQSHFFELSKKELFQELSQIWEKGLRPEDGLGVRTVFSCMSIKRKKSATGKGWGPSYWEETGLNVDEVSRDLSSLVEKSWKFSWRHPRGNEGKLIIKAYKDPSHTWSRGRQYYTKYYLCW